MIAFSKLARLGDLRQYSLNELKIHLKRWKYQSIDEDKFIIAEWSNTFTSLKALYNQNGEFLQILEERWKSILSKDKIFRRSKKF